MDKPGRLRFSREQREALLDAFERSGMTGAAFAKEHGIKYQTFATWVQQRRYPPEGEVAGALTLAEVVVGEIEEPSPSSCGSLRVNLPGGASLEVSDRAQLGLAVEILRALQA